MTQETSQDLKSAALRYHAAPSPGKLEVRATKPLASPRDLSLAYSPGVAEACLAIKKTPLDASKYTGRNNLVAVVSNGTAALGLGDIGPLASKPIMEGKAVLFKQFAGINCFDIEVQASDPLELAKHVVALEPTFGAINLEDIKAPDCFLVEDYCRKHMNIPVFHDDQHGTAIVVGAAAKNALHLTNREFEAIKIVSTGGGAAGIACLNLLVKLGVKKENIWLFDINGLISENRSAPITDQQKPFAKPDIDLSLSDALVGADLFLGLSGGGIVKPHMVANMAEEPIILALANPDPEILPDDVYSVAPNAIVATGRSDYPNQVNNVLCFPFIFRGALDVGASEINDAMEIACVEGIAKLARETTTAETAKAYEDESLQFGRRYLIPKPFDKRLLPVVASAVAKAATETGVASLPLKDAESYFEDLSASVYRSGMIMRPVFEQAKIQSRRIAFAEGEDERVLSAANAMREDGVDNPILIGRPEVIAMRCEKIGLSRSFFDSLDIVNPEKDDRYALYRDTYHELLSRKGISPALAGAIIRTNTTVIGSVMVHLGDADSMICGTFGNYSWHLNYVNQILGIDKLTPVGALSVVLLDSGPLFLADTQVHHSPSAEQVAETTVSTARHIRRFGLEPNIGLCSNSQFGTLDTDNAKIMREAIKLLDQQEQTFEYEGEMSIDAALDPDFRQRLLPKSRKSGRANGLIFSNTETASAVVNSLKSIVGSIEIGPILMGMGNKAHIVSPATTARGLINIAALAGSPVQSYA